MTNETDILARYVDHVCRRLKGRTIARRLLVLVASAIAVTVAFSVAFVTLIPAPGTVEVLRVGLYLALLAGACTLVLVRVTATTATRHIESKVIEFEGRLSTWRDADRRGDDSPILSLLARSAMEIAAAQPPDAVVRTREWLLPMIVAAGLMLLSVMLLGGTHPLQISGQRLWFGDALGASAPRILVRPGDVVIPRGTDVIIDVAVTGFEPARLSMNANFEGTDRWEVAPLSRTGRDSFSFVFIGVTEEVDYYVGPPPGATGVNSQRYVIRVADLPRITDITLDYRFPEWTGLPVREQSDGELWALEGTVVTVSAVADRPLNGAIIVVNDSELDADTKETNLSGSFVVGEAGSWHIAVRHEGILTRISDTWLIHQVPDRKPEIAFEWPGRDRSATSIEEVGLRFSAKDDYRINNLVLRYSVNGEQWSTPTAMVNAIGTDERPGPPTTGATLAHTIYLENLRTGEDARPLKPGDVISVYGEASDHQHTVRSSLYFVDVRPFDRIYREGQQSGGGGSGGQGFESVRRQREILTATWNLINRREQGALTPADEDKSAELAELQRTLQDQVQTVIVRAGARGLGAVDASVEQFLAELSGAIEDMVPAAAELDRGALDAAIAPQQQALQHLLAAEASMSDVDVSPGEQGEGGGSAQSLEELVELELDPERNRYEVPQQPGESQTAAEDEWRKLEELAARQERLAEQQRRDQASTPVSRWQQEQLKRELEQIRQRLASRNPGRQQPNRQEPEGQNRQSSEASGRESSIAEALANVEQALEAMSESLEGNASRDRAAAASRSLTESARRLQDGQLNQLDQEIGRIGEQIGAMAAAQRAAMDRLEAMQMARAEAETRGDAVSYYDFTMMDDAEAKREMGAALADIAGSISRTADALDEQRPEASRTLRRAVDRLTEDEVDARLTYIADLYNYGQPTYAAPQEARVARSLERIGDMLTLARDYIADAPAANRPLDEVRRLRQALARTEGGNIGPNGRGVDAVRQELNDLLARLNLGTGANLNIDTSNDRRLYLARGIAEENTDELYKMTADRLDLVESVLVNREVETVRAQQPRDSARDSDAAAEYFRLLSNADDH
ncbi:MAG: hypothetical protein O2780_09295 [Proteobacteria bacterium]|nr:hypothetical protein [Pseudomonadota bacterium]